MLILLEHAQENDAMRDDLRLWNLPYGQIPISDGIAAQIVLE